MGVMSLCIRLLMLELILLGTQVQNSYTQTSDAAFLRITPNQLQHFQLYTISFDCEGSDSSTKLRMTRSAKEFDPKCDTKRTPTGSSCTIDRVYPSDSGEYWCETEGGERSNSVNITVTAGPVILESPALPVLEGDNVTLRCRSKTTSTNLKADFYKDDVLMQGSPAEEMTISNVSKSDEGLYKCNISGVGASPGSWLAVKASSVILESPILPVKEGNKVTLLCRKTTASSLLTADFYKDGLLMGSRSTGNLTIRSVSKSDEGLYKCKISDVGESPESWLAIRALHRDNCPYSDHSFYVLLLLRTVFTIVMVPLLLLLVGLLHHGKLRVTQK